jgi:hypothetical protein
MTKQIVPAQPGFQIVGFWSQRELDPATHNIRSDLAFYSVIAWELDGPTGPTAIGTGTDVRSDLNDDNGWVAV